MNELGERTKDALYGITGEIYHNFGLNDSTRDLCATTRILYYARVLVGLGVNPLSENFMSRLAPFVACVKEGKRREGVWWKLLLALFPGIIVTHEATSYVEACQRIDCVIAKYCEPPSDVTTVGDYKRWADEFNPNGLLEALDKVFEENTVTVQEADR